MSDSQLLGSPIAADLSRQLNGYLDGQRTIRDFLAWEAELSLDTAHAGALRGLLDRLSIVATEVCDGMRDESEFRTLARETVATTLAGQRTAVAETPASYTGSGDQG